MTFPPSNVTSNLLLGAISTLADQKSLPDSHPFPQKSINPRTSSPITLFRDLSKHIA
jgi:hypothetical protein